MFKEQMNKIKKLILKNTEDKGETRKDKRKTENLVVFLIILIITLIAINIILKEDEEVVNETNSIYKELAKANTSSSEDIYYDELEKKLQDILETIAGVRKSEGINNIFPV